MISHELLLLIRRELHHSELPVVVKGREDPIVDAEVRVAHVDAFHGPLHPEGDSAKVTCAHAGQCRSFTAAKRGGSPLRLTSSINLVRITPGFTRAGRVGCVAAPRTNALAPFRKRRVPLPLQHLHQGLLNETV